MSTVKRNVRFYAACKPDPEGALHRTDIDWKGLVKTISQRTEQENQVPESDGKFLVAQAVTSTSLVLLHVSKADLPSFYDSTTGKLRDLDDVLGGGDLDIAQLTYFSGFDRGVLGMVYNHYGAKRSHFSRYLDSIFEPGVELTPIPRTDVMDAIKESGQVRKFVARVPTSHLEGLTNTSLHGLQKLAGSIFNADIEISITARSTGREDLARFTQETAPQVAKYASKLKAELASGEDVAGSRALDLLDDTIVVEAEIETPVSRGYLSPDAATKAITDAYNLVKPMIYAGLETL